MNYTQAGKAMRVKLGGIGTPWCAVDPDGLMVLMGHSNYFTTFRATPTTPAWKRYVDPGFSNGPRSNSLVESHKRIAAYYADGNRGIAIIEAEFTDDGGPDHKAVFGSTSGKVQVGIITSYDATTGRLECMLTSVTRIHTPKPKVKV
jgi:hypothetical protein